MSIAPAETETHSSFVAATSAGWRLRLDEGFALLRLIAPIALISLVNMGMSVTDTIMVSALFGTEALAAIAVGSDLYSIVFYLCAGVLAGIAPFYTAAAAKADARERARIEQIGWMTVGLLALIAVPLIWFAPDWLQGFGIAQELLVGGQGYTRAMALTLVPMLGVMLYRTLLTAAEKPKVFLKVTAAMLPLNAIANYVFMKGVGPVPAFGPAGAGISSLIVALASLAVLGVMVHRAAAGSASLRQAMEAPDWRAMAAVLRVGIPIGIATVAELGIFLGATLYVATLGAADVAAHTLALRTAGVVYALPAALLQASMVRMARAESLRETHAGGALVFSSLTLSVIFGTAIFLILAVSAEPLSAAFFDESAAGALAMQLAIVLLILLGLVEFLIGPGSAAAGLLRGRKDTRAPMMYVLIGHWAVGAPLGILLCESYDMGVLGIWTGLAAGTLITTLLTLARLLASRR